jgi:hypothetical protein
MAESTQRNRGQSFRAGYYTLSATEPQRVRRLRPCTTITTLKPPETTIPKPQALCGPVATVEAGRNRRRAGGESPLGAARTSGSRLRRPGKPLRQALGCVARRRSNARRRRRRTPLRSGNVSPCWRPTNRRVLSGRCEDPQHRGVVAPGLAPVRVRPLLALSRHHNCDHECGKPAPTANLLVDSLLSQQAAPARRPDSEPPDQQ